MCLERRLDFLGKHFFAARVDAHRPTSEQHDGSVLLHGGHVSRNHPTSIAMGDERRRRLRLIAVISDRDMPRSSQPADLLGPGSDRLEVVVEHRRAFVDAKLRACAGLALERALSSDGAGLG